MEDLFAPRIAALHAQLGTLVAYENASRDSLDTVVPACETMIARAIAGNEAYTKRVITLWLIGTVSRVEHKQIIAQLEVEHASLKRLASFVDSRRIDLQELLVGMVLTLEAAVESSNKIARTLQLKKDFNREEYPDNFELIIQEAEGFMREQEGNAQRLRLGAVRIAEELEDCMNSLHVNYDHAY